MALSDVTATVAFEGRIYVFGGWDGMGVVSTTYVYDPAADSWTTRAPLPTPRSNALAGVIGGRIAVIGGLDVDPARREYLDVVEVYDPVTDSWCLGPVKPTPASQMAIGAPTIGDRIHAIGTGHPLRQHHEVLFLADVDRDLPQIACPADLTLECPAVPAEVEAWRLGAVASDECSTVTVESVVVDHRPGCGPTWHDRYRFTATDSWGNAASCEATLTVVDTAPPAVDPDPDGALCLWPPNHRLVCLGEESIGPRVKDACDPAPAWRYTGCASSQPDDAPAGGWNGDGRTKTDCVVPHPGQRFCVRAERAGHGPDAREGRRYTVTVVAEDACGNTSAETEVGTVDVPHEASAGGACLSARPAVRSPRPRLNGAASPGVR